MVYTDLNLITIFILTVILPIIFLYIVYRCNLVTWAKDKKIFEPFVFSLLITLIILAITLHISGLTDNVLDKINNTSQETYKEVKKLSGSAGIGTVVESGPPIKNKIIKTSLTPDGTITFWIALNRSDNNYQKGYIFDIADSYVKSRMSLFVDENGFLTWRLIDTNFTIYDLRYDINQFLKGERFFVALTWTKEGELKMYINAKHVSEVKLDRLDLNINSTNMYWGSDIDGNHAINLN